MKKLARKKGLLAILAVIVLAVSVFALTGCFDFSGGDDKGGDKGGDDTSVVYKGDGTYEVGKDISAGEYILYPSSTISGYIHVTKVKGASVLSDDSLYNAIVSGRWYVVLEAGQFIKIERANLYKPAEAPALAKNTDGSYKPGQYKIGTDIEAGDYIIVESGSSSVYLDVTLSPNASAMSDDFLFNDNFSYRHFISPAAGQYISFNGGGLYKVADAPALVKNTDGSYKAGQYKVGTDIPAGSYVLTPSAAGTSAYYEITTLPLCSAMSAEFLDNDNFSTNTTITLESGQYLQFTRASLTVAA